MPALDQVDRPWPVNAPGGPSLLGRRPELLPIASVALAWALLLLSGHINGGASAAPGIDGGHAARISSAHISSGYSSVHSSGQGPSLPLVDLAGIPVMTIATMGLLAIPVVRSAAAGSLWWRSGRAAAVVFLAFVGGWVTVAAALHAVAGWLVPPQTARSVTVGLLVISALLQLHPGRIALVKRCQLAQRIRPFGWAATADCTWFGLVSASRCARLCAVPMAAMLTAPASLGLMAGVAAATLADRVCGGRRALVMAACYALLAAAVLVW